jgi:AcrR family transcriptional regulator
MRDARQDRSGALTVQRRTDIRRVAAEQFAEFGYQGASLRQIAAASGMAPGHLYYYYPSKQDLLQEVIAGVQRDFNALMEAALDAPGRAAEVLRTLLADHVKMLCANVAAAGVSYECIRFLTPGQHADLVARRDAYESGLRTLIERCRSDLPIAALPTTLLGKAVLGIINWPYQWYRASGADPIADLATSLSDRAVACLLS